MPQENWQCRFSDSILGLMFHAARRNSRGPWIHGQKLPEHVRQYLNVAQQGRHWLSGDFKSLAELDACVAGNPDVRAQRAAGYYVFKIDAPPRPPRPRKIPRNVRAIRSLRDLCRYFSADDPTQLNRRIYKGTDCGASISVQTPDGKWHHCGEDWSGIKRIVAFTIQTIVEGSDAEVNSDEFTLPVTCEEVDRWVQDMEAEASRIWDEANREDE